MPRKAAQISLNSQEAEILQKIVRSRTYGKDIQARSQIVLAAAEGLTSIEIERQYEIEEHRVSVWRRRFYESHEQWKGLDAKLRPKMNEKLIRNTHQSVTLVLLIAILCGLPLYNLG